MDLTRELHRVFISFQTNLSVTSDVNSLIQHTCSNFRHYLFSLADRFPELKEISSMLGLFEICFLNSTLQSDLVEYLVRWLHFYYPVVSTPKDDSWKFLGRLVMTRRFDQACLVIHQLIVDEDKVYLRNRAAVDALFQRLVEFPAAGVQRVNHGALSNWILVTRDLLTDCAAGHSDLGKVIGLLLGDLSSVKDMAGNWAEAFIGYAVYGECLDIEGAFEKAIALFDKSDPITLLSGHCIRFDIDQFTNRLQQIDNIWLKAHLGDLLAALGLVSEGQRESWIIEYTGKIGSSFWNIVLDYYSCCPNQGKALIETKVAELSSCPLRRDQLVGICSNYGLNGLICMIHRKTANEAFDARQLGKALYYSIQAEDSPLATRIIDEAFRQYLDTGERTKLNIIEEDLEINDIPRLSLLLLYRRFLEHLDKVMIPLPFIHALLCRTNMILLHAY